MIKFYFMFRKELDNVRFPSLGQLYTLSTTSFKVDINMDNGIVDANNSYTIAIDAKDVRQFLSKEALDISWLKLAILYVEI